MSSLEQKIYKKTIRFIQDLYARETMRVYWYDELPAMDEKTQQLRAEKARHRDFLLALLRKRNEKPARFTFLFAWTGKILGKISSFLPDAWISFLENTLEWWIYLRYKKYFHALKKHSDIRSMIEAMQNKRFKFPEPGEDVLESVRQFLDNQIKLLEKLEVVKPNEIS